MRNAFIFFLLLGALVAPESGVADALERYRTEEVTYNNGTTTLGALFVIPKGDGPFPAAVIVHGSGASDRTNQWSRAVSDLFVSQGVAVLLTDKRGSGISGGDWRTASFEDLAADAIAGIDLLRKRKQVDETRIGLIGLSQGGWIVPLAAAKSRDVAFVVDFSGASVSFVEQLFIEMANTTRQSGFSDQDVNEVLDLNRKAGIFLVTGDWKSYETAREIGLQRPWKKIAAGFPATSDAPVWTFYRSVWAFDPLPYWTLVHRPVFFGFGQLDEQDNVPVQESVRRLEFAFKSSAKNNFTIVAAPGVGHALWNQDGVFAPEIVSGLTAWLQSYVSKPNNK